jgi:hypothetical protein
LKRRTGTPTNSHLPAHSVTQAFTLIGFFLRVTARIWIIWIITVTSETTVTLLITFDNPVTTEGFLVA